MDETGLTDKEQDVLDHLIKAYRKFRELPDQHADDDSEFRHGIHICQGLLMQRIARREYPAWKNEERDDT